MSSSQNRRPPAPSSSPNTGRRIGGPLHAYFTPRRPLAEMSAPNSSPSMFGDESPVCCDNEDDEQPRRKRLRTMTYSTPKLDLAPLKRTSTREVDTESEDEDDLPQPSVSRFRTNTSMRMLYRTMGTSRTFEKTHCGDWSSQVCKFYSRPEDFTEISSADRTHALPFSTRASNTTSMVAVGDELGYVRLLDTAKNPTVPFTKTVVTITAHENAVFDISWSKDDSLMLTASGDQSVRLFDVRTQQLLSQFAGHSSSIKQVNFHPQNSCVFTSCSRDGDIRIWDTRAAPKYQHDSNVPIKGSVSTIKGAHTATSRRGAKGDVSVTAAVWLHNDENAIASACEANAAIKYWDIRSISAKRRTVPLAQSSLPPHHALRSQRSYGLNSISLSPCGKLLYALCRDSIVYAYSTSHIEQGPTHAYTHPRLHASTFYVKTAISRDGSVLSVGSSDGTPILFPTDKAFLNPRWHPEDYGVPIQPAPIEPIPSSQPTSSQASMTPTAPKPTPAQLLSEHIPLGRGIPLVRGHQKEVTDMTWTKDGDMVAISDCFVARVWRGDGNNSVVERLRMAETDAERYMWGWASRDGSDALLAR